MALPKIGKRLICKPNSISLYSNGEMMEPWAILSKPKSNGKIVSLLYKPSIIYKKKKGKKKSPETQQH